MAAVFDKGNYELEKLKITELNKQTYYAKVEVGTVNIYTVAPAAAVAATTSLFDLIGDNVKNYELGIGDTPYDAVPFYVITEKLDGYDDYKVSNTEHFYILPSLTPEKIETKVNENKVVAETAETKRLANIEADRIAAETAEKERLAKIESDEAERVRIENEKQNTAAIEAERVRIENEKQNTADIEAERVRIENEKQNTAAIEAERVKIENEKQKAADIEAERVRIENEKQNTAAIEAERVKIENEKQKAVNIEAERLKNVVTPHHHRQKNLKKQLVSLSY